MGIFSKIRRYFEKKDIIKKQIDQSIPNYDNYNPLNKTIVFLSGNMPTPDKDSGSNRLKEIILSLKELNYNCIICAKNAYRSDHYTDYFSDLGIIVYVQTNQYKDDLDFLKSIPKLDYIWYYGPNMLKKNHKRLSQNLPNSKSIFDMVDIHFLRYHRAIELNPTQISLRKKYSKYLEIETKMAQKADHVITISDIEKEIMTKFIDADKLTTISNIHYPKIKKEDTLSFEDRANLLFIGSAHSPNIDAIHYLYDDIMPLVWKKLPEVKLTIIGNLIDKVNINHPKFIFEGYVPDIETAFINTKIMIAPLRYGAGVKGKVGQAFEYYLPVITSSIGAEGMNLVNKENALIEDTKEGFATAIIELYTNKELWLKLQNNSEQSLTPFSRENLDQTLSAIL